MKRPNVILIVIDTLRADHLGCYGYHRNTTPNIDKLADNSFLFNNAVATAPWTLPSIASILTSQYPCVLGIRDKINKIDDRFPLLSEELKIHNYITCGIVSHVLVSMRLGFGKGFDHYIEKEEADHKGTSSREVTNMALSFLKENHRKPFFLFLHYFDPHYNYLLHERYNYYPSYKGSIRSGHPIGNLWHRRSTLTEDDIKYLISLYDSEISYTDEHIGILIDELKRMSIDDNTIVIITADHGEEFMERGWIGHTITLHQELVRVPLIMKFPEYKERTIDTPVSLIDILPTVYKHLDLQIPDTLEGTALDLDRPDTIPTKPVFSETFNPQIHRKEQVEPISFRSIQLGRRKLIYDQRKDMIQDFDLSSDPLEQNNLASQESDENRLLRGLLSKWIKYVSSKTKDGPIHDQSDLFTPEQRKQLESLGYL
jgi:arylsulfatase A-like enzyme